MFDPYAGFVATVLPNGLTIYSLHMPNRPQSFSFIVHTGAKHDPDGKEGLAHFTEHMMSANSPADYLELHDYFDSFGGSINLGTTNFEATWYAFKLPCEASAIAKGLSLMGTMLTETTLERNLEREREVIFGEYRRNAKFDEAVALEMRRRELLFPGHWFTRCKEPLGTRESIAEITLEDIQQFHDARYVPANISIVSVGGVETQELIKLIKDSTFGGERPGEACIDFVQPVPFLPLETTFERIDLSSIMKMAAPAFESYGKVPRGIRSDAIDLFQDMLNEVLNEEVREKRAWTYAISTRQKEFDSFYEFNIGCPSFSDEAQEDIAAVVSDCIRQVPENRTLFEKVKRHRLASFLTLDPTASGIAGSATNQLIHEKVITTNTEDRDEIDSVRFEEMGIISEALDDRFRYTRILHP